MLKDDWEELVGQVEAHGPEAVEFYLGGIDEANEMLELDIMSVQYTEGRVKVVME